MARTIFIVSWSDKSGATYSKEYDKHTDAQRAIEYLNKNGAIDAKINLRFVKEDLANGNV
ncbi:MAG: hypothetical protein Q4C83_01080 [Candidatus Saccharibacteria bacterium]|nr:hypothetical protein [Candidatus Saccharibacteria bacterium]